MLARTDLRAALLAALAGSNSKKMVDTDDLYHLGKKRQVEAELMALYQAREVCCCKITRGGKAHVKWWLAGVQRTELKYGYGTTAKAVRRRGSAAALKVEIIQLVSARPGIRLGDISLALPGRDKRVVQTMVSNMVHQSRELRAEGKPKHYGYFVRAEAR